MWEYIIALIIGAAIPLITIWFQSREKQKYFELERKEKFKMVEIEKRLAAHQEAIKQWNYLQSIIHSDYNDHKTKIINNAREYWLNNCLYLEKRTRKKFAQGINIVSNYRLMLDVNKTLEDKKQKKENSKEYLKQWEEFHRLFETIQEDVELEPIKLEGNKTPEGEDK